ncbi:MAG: hypothetical protein COA45_02810 [Zetaproteobacteria bacterium]|nr:MAG: hypothetical protein COA45_02810 [Zetaproteobacteria bacterium]
MGKENDTIPNEGVIVKDITLEEYEAAETFHNVRQACTLVYNELATAKEPGDSIVFSSDTTEQSVTLTFEAAQKALEDTNQENISKYGIPTEQIKIGVTESQKPVPFEFTDEHNL